MDDSKYIAIILEIISVFDQQRQAEKTSEALLNEALTLIFASFPTAEYIRAYRLGGAYLNLWVTSEASPPQEQTIEVESAPAYDWALRQFMPTVDGKHWIIPLYSNQFNQGVLQIGYPGDAPPDVPEWLQLAARQISMALSNRSGRALTTMLGQVTAELTGSRTFREIAAVIGRHLLENGQFLSINLNRYNAQGEFSGFEVAATANRHKSFDADEAFESANKEFGVLNEIFTASAPVIVDDVAALEPQLAQWLAQFKVKALCIMPLRSQGQVFGFMSVNSLLGRMNISSLRLQVYQSLADQMSSLVRLHRLIEASEYTATLGERLSIALGELSVEQQWDEMAFIVARNLLPQPGRRVGINVLERDAGGEIISWRLIAAANSEGIFEIDLEDPDINIPWSLTPRELREQIERGETITINDMVAKAQEAADPGYEWFANHQVGATLGIPLMVDERAAAFMAVVAPSAVTFSREEINAFRSLGNQLSALLHVQRLLEEAQATQRFAVNLQEAFRAILVAEEYETIMAAAIQAMPNFVEMASLALFDPPVGPGEIPREILADTFVFRDRIDQHVIVDVIDAQSERLVGLLDRFRTGELFVIPELAGYKPVMSQNIIHYLHHEHNINAIGTMGLVSGPQLLGMLTFGATGQMPTDGSQNANFQAIADQIAIVIQNRQLVNEARINADQLANQVRVLRVLAELSTNIVAAEDETALLNQSSRMLAEALGVDRVTVIMLHASGESGTAVSQYPTKEYVGRTINLTNNDLLRILGASNFDLMLIYDTDTDSQLDEASRQFLRMQEIKSLLVVPLGVQGKTIGFIELDMRTAERHFTPEMVDIAQTIASQVSIGLQNLRLLSEAQRRAAQLQYIASFSQAVQATLDLAQVFEVALKESTNVLRLDYIAIIMYDPVPGHLRMLGQMIEDQLWVDLEKGTIIPQTGTTAGAVWENRTLLHIADLRVDKHLTHALRDDLRSLLVAPIFARGLMLGMVEVACFVPAVYNETDMAVFQQMVNQLGVAIENAEAYSQSQKLAKNKALVNEISTQLQQQAEMGSILQVTMQELGKALGARRARVRLGTAPNGDKS